MCVLILFEKNVLLHLSDILSNARVVSTYNKPALTLFGMGLGGSFLPLYVNYITIEKEWRKII